VGFKATDRSPGGGRRKGRKKGKQKAPAEKVQAGFRNDLLVSDGKDIMISDGQNTYAVAGFQSSHNHAYFDPRTSSYSLQGNGLKVALPINGRALAKAGDVIFVAGEQMKFSVPTWKQYEDAYAGKSGGQLLALTAAGGETIGKYKLDAAPVWDSIALAGGHLYVSLEDGTIQCMGK